MYRPTLKHAYNSMSLTPSKTTPPTRDLKLQFNENPFSAKKDLTPDIPQTIHNQSETKSATFIDEEELIASFQQRLNITNTYRTPSQKN